MKPVIAGNIKAHLIWFDSMGAKSSSVFLETPDIKLLIDPGAAVMQPSFPLSDPEKEYLRQKAFAAICKAAKKADGIFISHYHYDHHTLPDEQHALELYEGKKIWLKNPNLWINRSQWGRARLFLGRLHKGLRGKGFEKLFRPAPKVSFPDPLSKLPVAADKQYGNYQKRKKQLLRKGKAWFKSTANLWKKGEWVPEFSIGGTKIFFADGKTIEMGDTRIRFTEALFHGIEYGRVGWMLALVCEHKGAKFLYSSDLQGPQIEDYADWIIEENPDILILDGPATYLLGYMLNKINLARAISNASRILKETTSQVIIYDHHLARGPRFKERISKVYEIAREEKKTFITAAEWMDKEPLVLKLAREKAQEKAKRG
jgi:hypothetical protein